ncbi:MAG TPA: HD domain-containing protein [Opitutaceae bacterium]|jgi:3'-5' exoribonuclease|nr:HD domain-containing protein [Opitutaceae bacterium]
MAESSVQQLKALAAGQPFASILVLRKLATKTASNGNPYLSADLGDRTGSFSTTIFNDSPVFEIFRALGEGAVVRVEGRTDTYQGRLAPRLAKAAVVKEEELSNPAVVANLVEAAPEDAALLWQELQGFVAGLEPPELKATVQFAFDDVGEVFRWAPAAISMHHAYRHGLLEHTVHMARAARALLPLYPEVDPNLALAGILLHDTGKTIEYEGALAPRRSRRGILQGHVVLGYQLVRRAGLKARLDAERLERLEHVILSHQGELEWGAAAMAATPEAVFVSMIDNLDAKMGMVQRALRQAGAAGEFSERLPGLNSPLLTKSVPPPASGDLPLLPLE